MSLLKRTIAPLPVVSPFFRPVIFTRPEPPAPPTPPPPPEPEPKPPKPPKAPKPPKPPPELAPKPPAKIPKARGLYVPCEAKRKHHRQPPPKAGPRKEDRKTLDPLVTMGFTVTVTEAKLLRAAAVEAGANSFSSYVRMKLLGAKHA